MAISIKQRFLVAKFKWACMRETGNVADTNKLLAAATRAQDSLIVTIAHSNKEFVGDNFFNEINHRIFSEYTPESLSCLFYKQAEIVHETERSHYQAVTRTMPNRIRTMLEAGMPGLTEEHTETLTEALLEQSLAMGDHMRTLAEALYSLSKNLEELPPYLQREVMRPHEKLLLEDSLLPAGFSFQ